MELSVSEETKVAQVQLLCQFTMSSAEAVAAHELDWDIYEHQKERYQRNKLKALQITNSIVGRFHFEAALHHIIDLCVAANEMNDAIKIFNTITVDVIRESILKAHPNLGQNT